MTNNKQQTAVELFTEEQKQPRRKIWDVIDMIEQDQIEKAKIMTKMEKEFVPYELALELKEIGFNEPCLASYYRAGRRLDIREYINHGEYTVLAPTYAQAFRFFREKHGLGHMINGIGYESFIMNIGGILHIFNGSEFNIYEEAELRCLKHLIKTVKENENQI
jgi:hypothetical protein